VSTCTFQDPASTGPGTDTVVFFVDEAGDEGPDEGDPQDAVQVTWSQPQPPPTATPGTTATPSPTPGPAAPEARNVRLCHGSASTSACDTAPATRTQGDDHGVAVLVTDGRGNPVSGVPVELRVTGRGSFAPYGASAVVVTTGRDGTAHAILRSEIEGMSAVVAEISPPGTPGGFRGSGASDDECEQPPGAGGSPPAGNCVSQTLTVTWEREMRTICSDGLDNDADGFTDLDDPGCTSVDDDSELPTHGYDVPAHHDRLINMRFRDGAGPRGAGLLIFGRLRPTEDDDDFRGCIEAQPVRIQRRVDGDWETVAEEATNARGRYRDVVLDKPGRYRVVAPRTTLHDGETDLLHVCRRSEIRKSHHHRR
jgi:hypothetical protein